jgi:type I restriction enzyme S subunit
MLKLNELCHDIIDCEHKTAPTQENGYLLIRTTNIGEGRLLLDGVKKVSSEIYAEWTKRATPNPGDLILAREAPVGNVSIIPENLKVCLGQRTVLIKVDKSKADPRYLMYLLLGNAIQKWFKLLSAGATVAHLNVGETRELELPQLHSLNEKC